MWRALDIPETGADPAGDYVENRYDAKTEDVLRFVVRKEAGSGGSRSSGKSVRAKLEDLMAMYPNYPVNIDFGDISVVSSSFADEFLGKLFVRMGALRFMSAVRLRRMSRTVRAVLDSWREVAAAVAKGLAGELATEMAAGRLPEPALRIIPSLEQRYRSSEWTLRR